MVLETRVLPTEDDPRPIPNFSSIKQSRAVITCSFCDVVLVASQRLKVEKGCVYICMCVCGRGGGGGEEEEKRNWISFLSVCRVKHRRNKMAPPHVSLGYKCFHNALIFVHSSITLARGGGGWSQFLWNVYLIIAHHTLCTIFADSAG